MLSSDGLNTSIMGGFSPFFILRRLPYIFVSKSSILIYSIDNNRCIIVNTLNYFDGPVNQIRLIS